MQTLFRHLAPWWAALAFACGPANTGPQKPVIIDTDGAVDSSGTGDTGDTVIPGDSGVIPSGSAPTIHTVAIRAIDADDAPVAPTALARYVCDVGTSDDDGDTVTVTITWTVDGETVGSGATLDAGNAVSGDTLTCEAAASDGSRSTTGTTSVTVEDTLPTEPELALDGGQPGEDLTCTLASPAFDADGDALSYVFTWTRDGAEPTDADILDTAASSTVQGATVPPHTRWTCTVEVVQGVVVGTDTAEIDVGCPLTQVWDDLDGDGWGGGSPLRTDCEDTLSGDEVNRGDDCDDTSRSVNPDASEIVADGIDSDCDGKEFCYVDTDGDSYGTNAVSQSSVLDCLGSGVADNPDDCRDSDGSAYPGATEEPVDGVDQSCDGFELCYTDADQDGYGNLPLVPSPQWTCIAPGVAPRDGDCDDSATGASVYPGAPEIVADGIDQDCNDTDACWLDGDKDGYGGVARKVREGELGCAGPVGASAVATDCDDSSAAIYPGAPDPSGDGIDQSCSGAATCFQDLDKDGWGSTILVASTGSACDAEGVAARSGDCNDNASAIYPTASETPVDGVDQDCDGFESCYTDLDGDQWGVPTLVSSRDLTCLVAGAAARDGDCDDRPGRGANIYPDAPEVPGSGIDESCDSLELCYVDGDKDGYGSKTTTLAADLTCTATGLSPNPDDCDDMQARVYPKATETIADGIDQDCDGGDLCYEDRDNDTWGSSVTVPINDLTCDGLGRTSSRTGDCNDNPLSGSLIYPGALDLPIDGIDSDCDGKDG